MCLLIHKKAGQKIKREHYERAFFINDDGAGIAFVDPTTKQLTVEKGFMKFDDAIKAIEAREDLEMMIHFRRTSRGETTPENCHPFTFTARHDDEGKNPNFTFAVGHNGTLTYPAKDGKSDTACFVEDVLQPLLARDPWFLDHPCCRWMLREVIGPTNKFVVMRYDNFEHALTTVILNRSANMAHDVPEIGWFSNYSYVPPVHNEAEFVMGGERGCHPFSHMNYSRGEDSRGKYEGVADHLDWIWSQRIQMFVNLRTLTSASTLSYRTSGQDEYTYEGAKYYRLAGTHKITSEDRCKIEKRRHEAEEAWVSYKMDEAEKARKIRESKQKEFDESQAKARAALGLTPITQTIIPISGNVFNKPPVPAYPKKTPEEEAFDKEYSRNRLSQNFHYFTKQQRKEFKDLAKDFVATSLGEKALKHMSNSECIGYLRDEYRQAFPGAKVLTVRELDTQILNRGGIPDFEPVEVQATESIE